MITPGTIRRALKRLPAGCVEKHGRKLLVHARHWAKPEDVFPALEQIHLERQWHTGLIVRFSEEAQQRLCDLLVLNRRALHDVFTWTKMSSDYRRGGQFDYGFNG